MKSTPEMSDTFCSDLENAINGLIAEREKTGRALGIDVHRILAAGAMAGLVPLAALIGVRIFHFGEVKGAEREKVFATALLLAGVLAGRDAGNRGTKAEFIAAATADVRALGEAGLIPKDHYERLKADGF